MSTFHRRPGPKLRASAIAVAVCFSGAALANPTGGTVVAGSATFATSGNTLTVTNTPGAIINWQQFSIQKDEVTRFIQQNAASAVLNRVTTQNPSAILGTLASNGRVFLINPSGIAFGQGAVINVAGLAASTLNLSDSDFLAGRMRFTGTGTEGSLTNAGRIVTSDGGHVYLIAPNVQNQAGGVIKSPNGQVVIAAGNSVELVNAQTPDIRVQYTAPANEAVNAGEIVAASGRVGVYGTLIRNSGLVSATAATLGDGGKIVFKAAKDVTLENGSRVEASGAKGGEIQVLGERVALLGDTKVDASGANGGGTVLVGGDFQGKNPDVQNAQRTYVSSDASIKADAADQGDGGKVVVWADGDTRFHGGISARGGATGGNGGNVEVSGKQGLAFDGRVDTSAKNGTFGTLLLDPTNIYIASNQANATGAGMAGTDTSANTSGNPFTASGAVQDSLLTTATLAGALAGANVVVTTANASGTGVGNITVVNALTWASANSLTLTAANNIALNATVTTGTAGSALILNAGGTVTQSAAIAGAGGLTKNGAGTLLLTQANTYTGTTTVNSGTLQVGNAGTTGTLGTGAVSNNAALVFNRTNAMTVANVISGSGTVTQAGTGTTTVSGANTYTGATNINAGTLTASNAAALGSTAAGTTVASGATLNINNVAIGAEAVSIAGTGVGAAGALQGAGAGASLSGAVTLSSAASIGGAGTLRLTGGISGTGPLTKVGTGTLDLGTTASTYGGATTISAGTLRLQSANMLPDTTALTATGTLNLNNFSDTVGSLAGAGGVTLGTATLSAGGDNTSTLYSGVMAGTGGLTKQGSGTLTLTGANTYTGTTTISAGTLQIGNAGTVGAIAGGGVTNNGTLAFNRTNALAFANVISGTGGVTQAGTGTTTLSGANTYAGVTNVNAGTLTASNAAALGTAAGGTAVASGATLNINNVAIGAEAVSIAGTGVGAAGALQGAGAGASLSGAVTLSGGASIGGAGTLLLTGGIGGTGPLTKVGTGTLDLGTTASTYTGATTISAGTLRLQSANMLPDTTALTATGTFNLNNFSDTVGSLAGAGAVTLGTATLSAGGDNTSTVYGGVMSGAGGNLVKQGSGTLALSGANTYTGTTTVSAGTLQVGNAGTTGALGTGAVTNNAAIVFNRTNALAVANVIGGTGTLTQAGSGTTTLSGVNTYTGGTSVTAGTLAVASDANLGGVNPLTLSGGALQTTATFTLNAGRNVTLGASGGTFNTNAGTTLTYNGVASGAGLLTKAGTGTLVLGGANTYAGGTTVNAGTLSVAGNGNLGGVNTLTLNGGTLLATTTFALDPTRAVALGAGGGTFNLASPNTLTYNGTVSGAGALTKTGTGTLVLGGANTYTGATAINGGTLSIAADGNLGNGTSLTFNGGTLATTASFTLGAGRSITLTGANTLNQAAGTTLTYSGTASGAGSLAKAGTGMLVFGGANTYTGATTVGAGTLAVTSDAALGTAAGGTTVSAGATLDLQNVGYATAETLTLNGTLLTSAGASSYAGNVALGAGNAINVTGTQLTLGGTVSGANALTKTGGGTLVLNGTNTYTGATNINAGTLAVTANAGLGTAAGGTTVASGATLDLRNVVYTNAEVLTLNGTLLTSTGTSSYAGNVALGAGSAVAVQGSQLTLSGVVSGANALTKASAGALVLSGANTYSGATNVGAGTLIASNASALGTTAAGTTVSGGATLNVNNVAIGAEALTLNGTGVGGNGALTGTGAASLGGQVTLNSDSSIGVTGGNALTLSGAVQGPGGLSVAGGGSVTLGGAVGNTTALASFTSDAATALAVNGGSVRTSGNQSYGGATSFGAATTLTATAGSIAAAGAVTATAGILTLNASGDATLNNTSNNFFTVQVAGANNVSLVDANALTVGPSSSSTLFARTLTSNLTLGGNITATGGGDSIVLVAAGNFLNPSSRTLSPGAGRWLVYSTDPSLDTRGGLAYNFKQYNATYGVTPVAGSGSGFLYTLAPTITATLGGSASRTYDGTTAAPTASLTLGQSGAVDGDTVGLNISSASYDTRNVGTGKTVTANVAISGASNGAATVYGYQLASPTAAAAVGTMTARAITVSAQTDTKVYDGGTTSAVAPAITSGSLVGGDTPTFTQAYSNRNVGAGKTLTASGSVSDGNGGNNYAVSFVTDSTGVITARPITVTAQTDTKVYDGGTTSAVAPAITSGSLVGGDTSTFTQTYNNRNVATGKTLTASGSVTDGNGGNNYAVTFVADNTGVITARPITVSAQTDSKGYDGTTASSATPLLTSGSLVGGDSATYSQTFANRNAGTGKTLNAAATITDGNGGNNYAVTYVADTTGVITARAITVTAQTDSKVYDGGTTSAVAPLITSGSLVGGDSSTFTQTYNNRNAGTGKTLTAGGAVSDGNGGNNYAVTFVADNTGVITARPITVTAQTDTKVYDGGTASIATPLITLGSLVGGDTAGFTQAYNNRNVGAGKTLTASGAVADGNGGNNYAVTLVADNTGVITARPITVTAQTDTKVYDGTTTSGATPLLTAGSLVGGDSATYSQSFADKNAGAGKTLNPAAAISDGNGGGNYAVTYVADATGVITQRPITVAVTGIDKVYDSTTAAAVSYADNRLAGDTLAASGSASFADPNTGVAKPVSVVALALSGPDAPNYALTSATASTSANITAAPLTIRANNELRLYGFANPPFSATYSGLQGTDTPASLTGTVGFSTPAVASSPVGTYAITPSGATSFNYNISYAPGVLLVVPMSISLPDPRATTYGPMNVPPPQGSLLRPRPPAPDFIAEGDADTATFLNTLSATGAGAKRPRLMEHDCYAYTPTGALSCVSTQ